MGNATLPNLANVLAAIGHFLYTPLADTPWTNWHEFWLEKICDDRFIVVWFFPLVPLLLLAPRDKLRWAIILTGLTFLAYVFGVFYACFWLLLCLALYRYSEWYARRAPDAPRPWAAGKWGAIAILGGGYLIVQMLQHVPLPLAFETWLWAHARWLFPLGGRGLPWEPGVPVFEQLIKVRCSLPLFGSVFFNAHSIGTAYLAVRMLHYFSELKRGTLPAARRTLLNFLAYLCYAPTLIQGPIERFANFQDELDTCHQRRRWTNTLRGLARIALGLSKSLIATLYCAPVLWNQLGIGNDSMYFKHPEQVASLGLLYLGLFLPIFSLYLEFSGYCDVAAGIARLLGCRQIENFNMPWIATSLRDFWHRWHISLSQILRDYIYIPLGGNRRHVVFNMCVTFALCGLWHRVILQLALWGLLMGLMLAVNQRWSRWMKKLSEQPTGRLPAIRRACKRLRPLPQIASWLLTQHAFVFSLLLFFGGSAIIRVPLEILRRLWACFT